MQKSNSRVAQGIAARLIMRANLTSISDCNNLRRLLQRVLHGPVASGPALNVDDAVLYRSVQQKIMILQLKSRRKLYASAARNVLARHRVKRPACVSSYPLPTNLTALQRFQSNLMCSPTIPFNCLSCTHDLLFTAMLSIRVPVQVVHERNREQSGWIVVEKYRARKLDPFGEAL